MHRLLYYRVSTIAHATEDINKVSKAILNLFPPDLRGRIGFRVTEAKGHWGNPIALIEAEVVGMADASKAVKWLASMLSDFDKHLLSLNLRDHVDKTGNLYIRVNKQDAYLGKAVLDEGDDIIKIVVGLGGVKRLSEMRRVYCSLGIIKC